MIDTFNHNRENKVGIVADVKELSVDKIRELIGNTFIPIVVAGIPCQSYSLAGNRSIYDPRGSMVDEFFRIIEGLKPAYFVIENVPGILSMLRPDLKTYVPEWIVQQAEALGYHARYKKLMAHHYGVGQSRPRVFFLGWLDGKPSPAFPRATHSRDRGLMDLLGSRPKRYVTVADVLAAIPPGAPNQDLVYKFTDPDYIARVEKLGPGESVYNTYKESHRRLDPRFPAFTMKQNHGSIAIHPTETRMITLREMAAFQDFPNDYEFLGDNRKIAEMIGNAVPVGLSRAVAIQIKKVINEF